MESFFSLLQTDVFNRHPLGHPPRSPNSDRDLDRRDLPPPTKTRHTPTIDPNRIPDNHDHDSQPGCVTKQSPKGAADPPITTHAVAGIDPHKHSGTVAVLSTTGQLLACESFDITVDGLTRLISILSETGARIERIGVDCSTGLGIPVVTALSAAICTAVAPDAVRTRRTHTTSQPYDPV
jgi:hypothetical protein